MTDLNRFTGPSNRKVVLGWPRFSFAALLRVWLGLTIAGNAFGDASKVSSASVDVPVLVILFDVNAGQTRAALNAIQSHLSGLGITIRLSAGAGPAAFNQWLKHAGQRKSRNRMLGVLAIRSPRDGETLVMFKDSVGSLALSRRISSKDRSGRIALEEAGIVVRSLIEALMESRRMAGSYPKNGEGESRPAGATPTESAAAGADLEPGASSGAPPLEPSASSEVASEDGPSETSLAEEGEEGPTREGRTQRDGEPNGTADSAQTPRDARRWALTLGYVGTSFATNTDLQSGIGLGIQGRLDEKLALAVRYTFLGDLKMSGQGASVVVSRRPFALSGTYRPFSIVSPIFEVSAFADHVRRMTLDVGSGLESTPAQQRWLWGFGARAGADWAVFGGLHARLAVGFDVPVNRIFYVVQGAPSETLVSSRSFRPQVEGSVLIHLW